MIGASIAESSNLPEHARAPGARRRRNRAAPRDHDQQHAEHLRQEQQHRRGREQARSPIRDAIPATAETAGRAAMKYFGVAQRMHRQQRRRQEQESEPQQRRQVRHDAAHEHRAVRGVQPVHHEQAEVHQVALAPAPVALELVDQVRRHLLVAAAQVVGDLHRPAGASHQRRFDEIVRQDFARQRAAARAGAPSAQCRMNGATRMIALWPQ